jgi:hypothetical protein
LITSDPARAGRARGGRASGPCRVARGSSGR